MQQIVYLALAFGSASAFVAPAAQAASSQLRSTPAEEIGVDPGPFGMTGAVPSGKFWEEQDGLARRRAVRGRVRINTANSRRLGPLSTLDALPAGRDQARPHLHDGVPRHDGPGARHHLPRLHDP